MTARMAVTIPVDSASVAADLVVPDPAQGIVVFAHGSGSGRHSPRNREVAEHLHGAGLATLLLDLLTAEEEAIDLRTRHLRFDVGLLADRLVLARAWLAADPATEDLGVGYFGASTGAAAALVAAAREPEHIGAVVSRGGRPDLAGDALPAVQAPTLLIVGSRDEAVLGMNRDAASQMRCPHTLEIVGGATHLFEEPGALDQVSTLAATWFTTYLRRRSSGASR